MDRRFARHNGNVEEALEGIVARSRAYNGHKVYGATETRRGTICWGLRDNPPAFRLLVTLYPDPEMQCVRELYGRLSHFGITYAEERIIATYLKKAQGLPTVPEEPLPEGVDDIQEFLAKFQDRV